MRCDHLYIWVALSKKTNLVKSVHEQWFYLQNPNLSFLPRATQMSKWYEIWRGPHATNYLPCKKWNFWNFLVFVLQRGCRWAQAPNHYSLNLSTILWILHTILLNYSKMIFANCLDQAITPNCLDQAPNHCSLKMIFVV